MGEPTFGLCRDGDDGWSHYATLAEARKAAEEALDTRRDWANSDNGEWPDDTDRIGWGVELCCIVGHEVEEEVYGELRQSVEYTLEPIPGALEAVLGLATLDQLRAELARREARQLAVPIWRGPTEWERMKAVLETPRRGRARPLMEMDMGGEWTEERDRALIAALDRADSAPTGQDPAGAIVLPTGTVRDLRAARLAERARAEKAEAEVARLLGNAMPPEWERGQERDAIKKLDQALRSVEGERDAALARVAALEAVLAEPATQAEAYALAEALRLAWCAVDPHEHPNEGPWTTFARKVLAVLRKRAGISS